MTSVIKTCSTCKESKPLESFDKNKRNNDGYQVRCKTCRANYYKDNREKFRTTYKEQHLEYVGFRQKWVLSYLKKLGCIECGETDPIVLEFDHIDRDKKSANVSFLTRRGYTLEKIKAEIDKCEIRCANCHRRRTAKQLGWYKHLDLTDL